jgi:hypothetical protein
MDVIRPPIVAGPMHRHWNLFTHPTGRTSSLAEMTFIDPPSLRDLSCF